jgi:chromate transport protein ChrA
VEVLIAILAIITVVLPVGIVIWKKLTKRPRKYSSAALKSFGYFFPATWTERRWWVFVAITAGILRRSCLPRLHVALLTRFSLDAESYAGAADFLSDLRT